MIPILTFKDEETQLVDEGMGRLAETISCSVKEVRNGAYELTMVYPASGALYKYLKNDLIIVAKPNETSSNQPFRIKKISSAFNGNVTIYAQHVSYDLSGIPVGECTATGCANALNALVNNSLVSNPFNVWTDVTNTTSQFKVFPVGSFKSWLGGREGSFLDVFSGPGTGEFEWNWYQVKFHLHRGADNGVRVEYGKNLTSASKENSVENFATGVIAYWANDESSVRSDIKYADNIGGVYPPRILVVDMSDKYESAPTKATLNNAAVTYINNNGIGSPKLTVKVSFIPLWNTEEYKSIAPLEHVSLCDTVTVYYPALDIDVKTKVIETDYNVLLERYNSVTLGDVTSTLSDTINSQISESIQESQKRSSKFYVTTRDANFVDISMKYAYSGLTHIIGSFGMLRPFIREGWGTSVTLNTLYALESGISAVMILTTNASVQALNTMWIARPSAQTAFQMSGATGRVAVTVASNGLITVNSTDGTTNLEAFYMAISGSDV